MGCRLCSGHQWGIIARAHSDAEVQHLERVGVPDVVMGEREIAVRMLVLSADSNRASSVRPVKG